MRLGRRAGLETAEAHLRAPPRPATSRLLLLLIIVRVLVVVVVVVVVVVFVVLLRDLVLVLLRVLLVLVLIVLVVVVLLLLNLQTPPPSSPPPAPPRLRLHPSLSLRSTAPPRAPLLGATATAMTATALAALYAAVTAMATVARAKSPAARCVRSPPCAPLWKAADNRKGEVLRAPRSQAREARGTYSSQAMPGHPGDEAGENVIYPTLLQGTPCFRR